MPQASLVDRDARQIRGIDLDLGHLPPRQMLAHGDRNEGPPAGNFAQDALTFAGLEGDKIGERVEDSYGLARLLGDYDESVVLSVPRQLDTEAVEDAPARRRQQVQIDPVLVRQYPVPWRLDHLQVIEPAAEQRHQCQLAGAEHGHAAVETAATIGVLTLHLGTTGRGCSNSRRMTPKGSVITG